MTTIPLVEGAYGRQIQSVRSGEHFDVFHQVPLVPQLNGMSCWAAAAAMLVGWRDAVPVEGPEVARGAGRWACYLQGLHPRDVPDLAATWGLHAIPEREHTVQSLRRLLEEHGPLWLGEAVPGLHVVAITGIVGDGTPQGTRVRVNDPWPIGRGERYSMTAQELIRNFDAASRLAGMHVQLLHSGGRRTSIGPAGGPSWITREKWRSSVTIDTDEAQDREPQPEPPRPLSRAQTVTVSWPADAQSICYRHMPQAGLNGAFALGHQTLEALAAANDFDLTGQTTVVFGLRGASMEGSASAFAASIQIDEDIPDHVDRHCLIGVWNRATRQVAAFSASTVPNAGSVRRQAASNSPSVANLLPTGLYTYAVGQHRSTPGALIQRGPLVVLRSMKNGVYESTDPFYVHFPADNIHPTFRAGTTFSSAGCNTVSGTHRNGTHQGDWREFRRRLGLSDTATSHPVPFRYMLLTGREARHIGSRNAGLQRLRFGSSGASVRALQTAMRDAGWLEWRGGRFHLPSSASAHITVSPRSRVPGDPDGTLLANTAMAWILYQRAAAGSADGIVTPAAGRALGFDIVRRMSIRVP